MQQRYVAVVGPGSDAQPGELALARAVGAELAGAGAVVLTGGMGGVMAAAAAGCGAAGGTTIGILPDHDRARANPESTFTVPTGLGELRNGLLVRAADAVICVALSWGSLSEVALAVRTGVPVVALGRWELPLAGPIEATTPGQAVQLALAAATGAAPQGAAELSAPAIHHLTLSVTDVSRSVAWYQALLGPAAIADRSSTDWERIRMQWPSGLVIGVTGHRATGTGERFDHLRVGLDHIGLACADEAAVLAWAHRLDAVGAPRGPVEDVAYGWAVTGRDPDDIPVEFFASR